MLASMMLAFARSVPRFQPLMASTRPRRSTMNASDVYRISWSIEK
jgi:hypothetical protein